jgi:nucleotide-binding universal stress UspA family protein
MEPFVPRLIVVPTDFSAPAAHALRYASNLAERFGAHLLIIHADRFMVPVDFTASPAGTFDVARDAMIEEACEELEGHAEQCISRGVPYDTRVIVNRPVDAIIEQLRETGADLIVMGTHGRTGVRRLLLGSVTEAVMRIAPVPVIAVNPRAPERATIEKALCPVDYTPSCADALRSAAVFADKLVLVRGVDQIGRCFDELPRLRAWAPPEIVDRCELKLMISNASPAEIVAFAREIDANLIALGIPSDRTLSESLFGSLAEQIVHHSACAVLTVNAFAARKQQIEVNVAEPVAVG